MERLSTRRASIWLALDLEVPETRPRDNRPRVPFRRPEAWLAPTAAMAAIGAVYLAGTSVGLGEEPACFCATAAGPSDTDTDGFGIAIAAQPAQQRSVSGSVGRELCRGQQLAVIPMDYCAG